MAEYCEHKITVVEDGMIFCVSFGEEIHRIISTGKDYSVRFLYQFEHDRTKRFTGLLDKCGVAHCVCMEIIRDFERVTDELLRVSSTHGKSKSKRLMNLKFVLYQLCNKNGIDVDKSKFKLPKSKKSREKHKNTYQEIFRKLSWNYISIF